MSERIQRRRSPSTRDAAAATADTALTAELGTGGAAVDYDALLDEIDGLLESDAVEYVKNFVQKGGQ